MKIWHEGELVDPRYYKRKSTANGMRWVKEGQTYKRSKHLEVMMLSDVVEVTAVTRDGNWAQVRGLPKGSRYTIATDALLKYYERVED